MSALTITIIQSNLHWEDKEKNLSSFATKIKSIQGKKQLVLLPEMFSTGFSMNAEKLAEDMDGPTIGWMHKTSLENSIILAGSLIIRENGKYLNRFIWMQPNGEFGYYDKRHLFAFAGEDKHYAPGKNRLITSVNGWKVNCQICYDLRFPVWARQQITSEEKEAEYDILLYVANWPERRSLAWKSLLTARAIENQCFVIGVNRVGEDVNGIMHSGDSMIIDPMGEILYHKNGVEDIFTLTIDKSILDKTRNNLPFLKDADQFHISD